MADKYVATDGDNGGTGSAIDPWLTAVYGFTNVGTSNTLKFITGTYDVDRSSLYTPIPNGTDADHPTIITDNGDGQVVFNHPGTGYKGILYFSNRSPSAQYISFIGTAENQLKFDMELQDKGNIIYMGGSPIADTVLLQNVELTRSLYPAFIGGQTSNLTFDNVHSHDHDGSSTGQRAHCIYASGQNLIIKNCSLYNTNGHGIHCYSTSSPDHPGRQFYNNTIYNVGFGGGLGNGDGILISAGSGTIYNNVIYGCGDNGIAVWRTANVTIYHNSLYDNASWGIAVGPVVTSGWASGTVAKNNLSIGNTLGDLKVYAGCTSTTLAWNRLGTASLTDSGTGTTKTNNEFNAVAATEWTSPATDDFTLKAGAGAIWVATTHEVPSVGIATDIVGASRNFIDQGAYAYGTTTPPDPPIISHLGSEVVTHEFTDVSLTLIKGTNNIVTCTISGAGASSLSATPTNVTVVRN